MIFYLNPNKNPSGAYSAPQSNKADGLIAITDEQKQLVLQYNGFVTLSDGEDGETIISPNTEAWEEWKQNLPEPSAPLPTINDLIKENELLKAQIQAQSDRNDFMEDCIAEMAMQIYS